MARKKTNNSTSKPDADAPRMCGCGCGEMVRTKRASFLPGHDSKLHSKLLKVAKGDAKATEIPDVARTFLQNKSLKGFSMKGAKLVQPESR